MKPDKLSTDAQIADILGECYAKPLDYVMLAFPWDSDPAIQVIDWENDSVFVDPDTKLIHNVYTGDLDLVTYAEYMADYRMRYGVRYGPDMWACEFLEQLGKEIDKRAFDGSVAVDPIQFATSSGHGIGKSTLVAWLIKFISDTRPYSKGTVTANTAEQLRTKTWAELGKWHKRSLTEHWFQYNSGRGSMSLRYKKHPEEWFCTAQTSREENSEAFAGQHAANSTSYYIFDEDSAVPDKIHEVREGGTTDGEPMTFDFGNPTRNSGAFFEECEGKLKHRYIVRKIDSRSVYITNKKRMREWVEDYGEDSDFVKVRVRGEFPSQGTLQFIPTAWAKRASFRPSVADRNAAVTIGVDVARFGPDNSVIYPVIGNDARSFMPVVGDGVYNGLDNVAVANKVIQKIEFFHSLGTEISGVFVDVGGVGAGVVDILNQSGYASLIFPVNFGNTPVFQPETYRYRSDEMWGRMKEAIKTSLILPMLPEFVDETMQMPGRAQIQTAQDLFGQLTQREFGYTLQGEKIHLETKKDMKARGLASPDIADALALNYAQDVARVSQPHGMSRSPQITPEVDPLAHVSID